MRFGNFLYFMSQAEFWLKEARQKGVIDYLMSLMWSQEPTKLISVSEVRRVAIFVERSGGPQKSRLGTGRVVITQVCT